ncbi:MAG: Gfo/Idh/MocA family oxidoreductase [Haloarculaceae archaeon]
MRTEPVDLGVVGVTEGNGHPYSFSAIINGYDDAAMADSEWGVIHDYLREKDPSEFGFEGASVTHAWTQDPAETERLCAAACVPNAVEDLEAMRDEVDAVLLLRDDHERHAEMALPFLESGVPTFVDKPLALDPDDVAALRSYLESGLLMSCSGLRYARELDGPRAALGDYGDLRLVRAAVLNDWATYGVHALDATFGVLDARPVAVRATEGTAGQVAATVTMGDGSLVAVDALGDVPPTFEVALYGSERTSRHELRDNFRAFRRTLWHFLETVRTGEPSLAPGETLDVVRTLVAGRRALETGDGVRIEDIGV